MDAIRTDKSNFTFLGPTPEIADLPTQVDRGAHVVWSVWKLSDEEREAIANGAQVKLGVCQIPMPPVSVRIVAEEEVVGPDERRCEGCGALWASSRSVTRCGHCGTAL